MANYCSVCDGMYPKGTLIETGSEGPGKICADCNAVRMNQESIFDFMFQLMERKIEKAIRSHENMCRHESNYDDF